MSDDSERARKLGKMVGKWRPAGRRMSPRSQELLGWQEGQLRTALDREGLGAHFSDARYAMIDELTKAVQRSDADSYRRAYGTDPSKRRKPSTRKLKHESRDEYVGRLRSMGLSSDEIYEKAYRGR